MPGTWSPPPDVRPGGNRRSPARSIPSLAKRTGSTRTWSPGTDSSMGFSVADTMVTLRRGAAAGPEGTCGCPWRRPTRRRTRVSDDSRRAGGDLHHPPGAGAARLQVAGPVDLRPAGRSATALAAAPAAARHLAEGPHRVPARDGTRRPGAPRGPQAERTAERRVLADRPGPDPAATAGRDLRLGPTERAVVTAGRRQHRYLR